MEIRNLVENDNGTVSMDVETTADETRMLIQYALTKLVEDKILEDVQKRGICSGCVTKCEECK